MSEEHTATSSPALALEPLTKDCGGGTCPTVYRSNRNTFVIQGYPVDGARAGIDLPVGELLVEVPVELVTEALRDGRLRLSTD